MRRVICPAECQAVAAIVPRSVIQRMFGQLVNEFKTQMDSSQDSTSCQYLLSQGHEPTQRFILHPIGLAEARGYNSS